MTKDKIKVEINIKGIVQGVGFRPFIYNLAMKYEIYGHILNKGNIVQILAQGTCNNL